MSFTLQMWSSTATPACHHEQDVCLHKPVMLLTWAASSSTRLLTVSQANGSQAIVSRTRFTPHYVLALPFEPTAACLSPCRWQPCC